MAKKIHRFIGNFDFMKKDVVIVDKEIVKQIRNVLKLNPGEIVVLSNGKGEEAEARIINVFSSKIECEVVKNLKIEENIRNVSLYLAVLKKDNFELAVQKATECGVSKIIPVITERTIKTGLNTERLNKIAKEASEQSGRSIVPEILETMSFTDAVEHGKENAKKIIFHLSGEELEHPGGLPSGVDSVSIFIGPEGGFTDKEVELAKNQGYKVASLGPLTLRGETAAIIATYRAVQGI